MKRVLFFRPTLGEGGADRVQMALLRGLDRTQVHPALALLRREGPFLADVPTDVEVFELGAKRLATSLPAFASAVKALRPDVIFSTCSASNIIAASAHLMLGSSARLVLSERNAIFRGRPAYHPKQALEVALKRVLYRRADLVTAVSQGVADELVDRVGVPRDRVAVVYNPMVDDELPKLTTAPIDHPWFEDGAPAVIVACARLVTQKDYPTLLDAFARVRRETECRLWVLGDGPLRAELVERAANLGLARHVHFAGFDKNPFRYMARAKLLLHASRAEGLPGALIQAMACGTPVVSTDCDFGPREVIHHGTDGYLVPVGDAAALARHAVRLLTDPVHRDLLALAARESASRFTAAASLKRYQDAILG